MKRINLSIIYAAAASLLLAASCVQEETPEPDFLYIKDLQAEYAYTAKGTVVRAKETHLLETQYATDTTCPRFSIYSNMKEWKVAPAPGQDADWVFFWPSEGSQCGKFFMSVDKTDMAIPRSVTINVTSGGKVMQSFVVSQTGAAPYLEIGMGGITRFASGADASDFVLKLNTNTLWTAEAEDDSWISFSDQTLTSITIRIAENTDEEQRTNRIFIKQTGENATLGQVFTISQLGSKDAFSTAAKKTIAEVKDIYKSGEIEDNIWTEGTVISDYTTMNLEKHLIRFEEGSGNGRKPIADNRFMWIEDENGDGLCVEFVSIAENCYPAGTHMKLHLVGKSASKDPNTGAYKIAGMSSGFVHDATDAGSVTPIEVTDFSDLAQYEDKLVTLKNVQFAMPYGTYFNVDERNRSYAHNGYLEDASSKGYFHILFNDKGQTVKLYSAGTYTQRHHRLMPAGSGDVTGIICRRISLGKPEWVLRMRTDADNKVEESALTSHSKTVVRFGVFPVMKDMNPWKADVGSATLKTSMFSAVTADKNQISNNMYITVWSTIWNKTFEDGTWATPSPAADNQYYAVNAQQWWNGTGTSITDVEGEAWILTVSTIGWSGEHFLAFTNGTFGDGPRFFQLEWSESEDAAHDQWTPIKAYEACSWNTNWQAGQVFIKLPEELNGKETVVVRHRVTKNESIKDATKTITGTATNRMCFYAIYEVR